LNFLGQDDIPSCYAPGECAGSLELFSMNVDTANDCLLECQKSPDCQFFNYATDGPINTCQGLVNCGFYSADSCTNCKVGKRDCPLLANGKIQK